MLALAWLSFFVFGIVLVLLGANQAAIARDLTLDLAESGLLGSTLALGLGIGVLVAGPLSDRISRRGLFVGACVVSACALLAVDARMSYARLLVQVTAIGVGCGFYETVINAVTVERFSARAAGALAFVHAAATAGAGAGPLLLTWIVADAHWSRGFHALGGLHLALAGWGVCAPFAARRAHAELEPLRLATPSALASPALCALALIAFAYVGVENGVTLFAVAWSHSRGEAAAVGPAGISAFWSGLLLGRLLLAARPSGRAARLLAVCGWSGALIVCATSQLARAPFTFALAAAGLALGPVYPVMIALAAQRFPQSLGTALGLVAGAGAAGGFCIPWLVGIAGDALGLTRAITLLGACLLLVAAAAHALTRADAAARPLAPSRT
jgi:fucose permease